ncbi:MAG: glycosyltransferase family 2 protein [Candidatus Tectomicrobia bacterium]|uniref:Glycosyltransferase family 2 protein n=1 Tax=Tectimicrobiota bacterium TaxID=2528274 RepID=A0A932I357_UNCTE|nr:glycosyltransferase family 2 protein [Candidatus Tectomicrobia bacterium]
MTAGRPPLAIVPAHNEEESIGRVIADLRASAPGVDILVVNDHSSDTTAAIVDRLGAAQIRLACNLGYRGALQIGCAWALANGYERAIFVDGDGQHPASEVLPMLERLERGEGDIVVATRFSGGAAAGASIGRFLGNQFFSRVASRLTGQRITDSTSGMKAAGPAVLPIIAEGAFLDLHAEALVYLGLRGFRIAEHPAVFAERRAGVSMYGKLALLRYPLLTGTLILCSVLRAWMEEGRGRAR